MLKNFVLGFIFRPSSFGPEVALITKNRPSQQAGKLNGIGGKCEFGEAWIETMIREFKEETGVYVTVWEECGMMYSKTMQDLRIMLYKTEVPADFTLLSPTDETIAWYPIEQLHTHPNLMPGLLDMIPKIFHGERVYPLADY